MSESKRNLGSSQRAVKSEKSIKKEVLKSDCPKAKDSKSVVKEERTKTAAQKRAKKEQLTSPCVKRRKEGQSLKHSDKIPSKTTLKQTIKKKLDTNEDSSEEDEPPEKKPKIESTVDRIFDLEIGEGWKAEDVLAAKLFLPVRIVKNVVRLLENENTIPFIARYRKEQTGNMDPEKLRLVKDNYEYLLKVKKKMLSTALSLKKMNKLTPVIAATLQNSQTITEIEHIFAQFKENSVGRTRAEKAKALGLEEPAMAILEGRGVVNPQSLVNPKTESLGKVIQGIQDIIAAVISKNKSILDTIRDFCDKNKIYIFLESKKAKSTEKTEKKANKAVPKKADSKKLDDYTIEKFRIYFSFKCAVSSIKPHQVLAIFRGETLKVLSVKIITPDWFLQKIKDTCFREWTSKGIKYPDRHTIMNKSIEDAYTRLLQPYLMRQIRSDLTEQAHRASIEVFAKNLKQLLLAPPVRGKVIMGIDPGYKHGCKVAVVNTNGEVLKTNVIYIQTEDAKRKEKNVVRSMLLDFQCELIALGNGTACRETETWIAALISQGFFCPLNVQYTIVDEQGVSIYSCSPIAKQEFPHLEPNLISAVSLARRIQDPLSELVKVEPKHLGVGMYQHDIPEKKLSATLDEVVVECVSFVGVDVNSASEILLRRVAGLNLKRASSIIEWRTKYGPFFNRDQLHLVKGIGQKTFEQCAGFLRIMPETSCLMTFGDIEKASTSQCNIKGIIASENSPNPLDQTWIHPESYATVYWLLDLCSVELSDFGSAEFTNKIKKKVSEIGVTKIASKANIPEERLQLILDGLKQKPDYDYRSNFSKPLFKNSICSLNDMGIGSVLTGRVQNITPFGAFVDVGVGRDGLLHTSQMRNVNLQLGDRIEVKIINIEKGLKNNKFSLSFIRKL